MSPFISYSITGKNSGVTLKCELKHVTGLLNSREIFACILSGNEFHAVMKNLFLRVETAELRWLAMLACISKGEL